MKKEITLQSKDDLWYLSGALCYGKYKIEDHQNEVNFKDISDGRTMKFDIKFIIPHTLTIKQLMQMQ